MDIEKRLMEYYKRWNIDFSYEEQFEKFKNRVIVVVDELISDLLLRHRNLDKSFSEIVRLYLASEPKVKKSQVRRMQLTDLFQQPSDLYSPKLTTEKGFGDTQVYPIIKGVETPQDLAFILQALFWTLEEHEEGKKLLPQLVERFRRLAKLTPSVSFNIVSMGGEIILYPHGEEILDKEVVNYVISELEKYPNAAKPFVQALKIYQSGDTTQYRNLLDNLRLALEQLLKNILGNERRGLEKHKNDLKEWMVREKKLHSNIPSLYKELLNNYTEYQNSAVKHDEKYSLDEVEFMIYLTATFMRLIIQLANEDLTEVDSQDVV